ncbi:MAG: hypothetical protein IH609_00670 [Dehalococcoidia bacterium]|nr:hypothetical protein [Dehalococcoidia bacterium]
MTRWKWLPVGVAVAVVVTIVAVIFQLGPWTSSAARTRSDLENVLDLSSQPPEIVATYRYVEGNRSLVQQMPCYCGCGKSLDHQNLFDCFVISRGVYSDHASGCMVCEDEANDVERLAGEGKSPLEIRAWIDAEYSRYGAPTDTPQ